MLDKARSTQLERLKAEYREVARREEFVRERYIWRRKPRSAVLPSYRLSTALYK